MTSPRAMVSLGGWIGLCDWSTVMDGCKLFRKGSLGTQGGDVVSCAKAFIKCTEDCYERHNRLSRAYGQGGEGTQSDTCLLQITIKNSKRAKLNIWKKPHDHRGCCPGRQRNSEELVDLPRQPSQRVKKDCFGAPSLCSQQQHLEKGGRGGQCTYPLHDRGELNSGRELKELANVTQTCSWCSGEVSHDWKKRNLMPTFKKV